MDRAGSTKEHRAVWRCQCECGNIVKVVGKFLRDGRTKSCGCYNRDKITKHGCNRRNNRTPEYNIWCAIKKRCYQESQRGYKNYGGRGIIVCERWLESFENFLEDMGPRPSKDHTIERRNNDGNYIFDNCYWATHSVQANNRRVNRYITIDGETKTMSQWCRYFGVVSPKTASLRIIRFNWDLIKAVSTPPKG